MYFRGWWLALLSEQNSEIFVISQRTLLLEWNNLCLQYLQTSINDNQAKHINLKNVVSLFSYNIFQHITAQNLASCVDYINLKSAGVQLSSMRRDLQSDCSWWCMNDLWLQLNIWIPVSLLIIGKHCFTDKILGWNLKYVNVKTSNFPDCNKYVLFFRRQRKVKSSQ